MSDQNSKTRQRKAKNNEKGDLENPSSDGKDKKVVAPRSATIIILQVLAVILVVFTIYVIIVPSPIDPVVVKNDPLPYFDGVMTPNTKLQEITKIGRAKLNGPESIQVDRDGNIYTGLHDGRIVKIVKSGEIIELARTGERLPNCGETEVEHRCGRPLGLQFDQNEENLIICDGYLGLMKLNIETSQLTTLIPASVGVQDTPFKFLNHLAVASDGKVYFTDSSWRWGRRDFPYLILEGGGQGRLLSYDLNTDEAEVLLSGLFFSNGVALSPDEDFVLISETTASRIMRYFIKGSRKGIYDVFSDNLPGLPDNIRPCNEGGYWVALPSIRKWPFSFLDIVGPYPRLKSVISKIMPKSSFAGLIKSYGLILKLDYYGDIIASYHDPDGSVISRISEVYEDSKERVLYLGSFQNDFLGKLRLERE